MSALHVIPTAQVDVPTALRAIADSMESGIHGKVTCCALAWDADELHVEYCGTGEPGPNAYLMLHAGAAKMMAKVIEVKT